MNQNGNFQTLNIKPIDLTYKIPVLQNWMNSPKANQPIKLVKPQFGLNQSRPSHNFSEQEQSRQLKRSQNKTFMQEVSTHFNNPTNTYPRNFDATKQHLVNQMGIRTVASEKGLVSTKLNIQNISPNANEYEQMHKKLNLLQDRLEIMKQKLHKKREQRKNQIINEPKKLIQLLRKQKVKKVQQTNTDALKQVVSQVSCNKNLKTFSYNPYSPRNHVYYVTEIIRGYRQENSLARDHIQTSIQQLKALKRVRGLSKQELQLKMLKLNKKYIYQGRKTVIFDLDQTLIHCNQNSNMPCDIKLNIKFPTGQNISAGINIRPYATEILKNLSKNFQIIVFTASHSCYANEVLNALDPNKQFISHRLFRQHCFQTPEGVYIKDLRIVNRQLSQIVLIDNAAYSYSLQIENGIPIIPFYQGKIDYQLKALEQYIQCLMFSKDVRDINRNTFKLNRYTEFDDPDTLVKVLYGNYQQ